MQNSYPEVKYCIHALDPQLVDDGTVHVVLEKWKTV